MYLGAMISTDVMCDKEIEPQVGVAKKLVGAMRKQVSKR